VDLHDQFGFTPIHYAAGLGNVVLVDFLLMHGAKVDEVSGEGFCPLHLALHEAIVEGTSAEGPAPSLRCAQLLIAYRASVVTPDDQGITPLHLLAAGLQVPLLGEAVQNGGEHSLRTEKGLTPAFACYSKVREQHEHQRAVVDALTHFFGQGSSLQERNLGGVDALYLAVYFDCPEVVLFLLEQGASTSAKTNAGLTALDRALLNDSSEVVNLLEAYGAKRADTLLHHFSAQEGESLNQEVPDRATREDELIDAAYTQLAEVRYELPST
jgi:ankyrin repeat protein